MQSVLLARWLNQPDDMPVVVNKTKKSKVIYLTGNKIAELLQKAVKRYAPTLLRTNSSGTPLIP
jgi:hypothetical protein